jgi:ParB-like chromosome segregation protein Spo0J
MSRFADETEPSPTQDLDVLFAKVPETAEREGLPRGFRMRADAHYVETLDSSPAPAPTLRSLNVEAIEATERASAAPPAALVESVRAHGLLQPLLVQHNGRGNRYRLIAGHQRLAAARSAGLREVPCLLHAVSDAKAAELASATRIAPSRTAPEPPAPERTAAAPAAAAVHCTSALDTALRSIGSAAALMSVRSPVARDGAAQLVAVESQRALRLLNVMRVLGGEFAVRRAALPVLGLLERVRESLEQEYRACGLERAVQITADRDLVLQGSEELLRTAICSAVAALSAAASPTEPRRFEISGAAAAAAGGSVVIEIREPGFSIPQRWVERAFDEAWPVADGGTALLLLQAARQIASSHSGSLAIHTSGDATVVRFTLKP